MLSTMCHKRASALCTLLRSRAVARSPLVVRSFVGAARNTAASAPASKAAPAKSETAKPAPKKEKAARAPSAIQLYMKKAAPEIKQVLTARAKPNEKVPIAEYQKMARERWATLPAHEKAPYEQQAAKLKAEVDKDKSTKKTEDAKNAKPINAYAQFMKDNYPKVKARKPTATLAETSREIASMWKTLSAAEKKRYTDAALQLTEAWKKAQSK